MRPLFLSLKSSDFLRHNGILFVGSLAVSVLNYLFYPVLGRLMTTSDFGEVQALISIFIQASIFLTVVGSVTVNIVTNEPNEARRNRIVFELEHVAFLVTVIGLAIALIFVGQIATFLHFPNVGPFFVLALVLLINVPVALRGAYLRGRRAFGRGSITSALTSSLQILCSATFVLLGWRTMGAIGGLVAAQLIALFYANRQTHRLGLSRAPTQSLWRLPDLKLIRPHAAYSLLVLIISLVMTTLFSFDILVIKHYFPANVAGQYAGVATVARIIYYLTGSIGIVLLSSVKLNAQPGANRRLLARSALLQLAIGGSALLVFVFLPKLVITLLMGAKYAHFAYLLPTLSLALFILAFASLIFNYDLALRRASSGVVAILGATVMVMIVGMHHATPDAVVHSLLWGAVALLLLRAASSFLQITGIVPKSSIRSSAKVEHQQ